MIHRVHVFSQRLVPEVNSCVYGYREACVGLIYDQFTEELTAWEKKYVARPREELLGLSLMALEREEVVTVGYREELMTKRLAGMPLSAPRRELLIHTLIFALR